MNASSSGGNDGALVGIALKRLAVAPRRQLPESVADDAHERLADEALEWQQTAGNAVYWEGAAAQVAEEGRVYSLAGLMASAGEQLALALAGAVEVALWQELRSKVEPDAEHEMSMRGMAEAQCLFIMGTGHAFANVAVRALAIEPSLRAELTRRFHRGTSSPGFQPFSMRRDDWVSLNAETCKSIRAVAEQSEAAEVHRLVEPVVAFGTGDSWSQLVERRGEDFHRWRPQTHGIEGVPRQSPWERDGRTRVLRLGHPTYDDAQGLADETARLASEAMIDVGRAMEEFRAQWPAASGHLGGPRFKLDR